MGICEIQMTKPRARTLIERLTPRERQVLVWLCDGVSRQQVAWVLRRSVQRVDTLVNRVYTRMGLPPNVDSLALAVRIAMRAGVVK